MHTVAAAAIGRKLQQQAVLPVSVMSQINAIPNSSSSSGGGGAIDTRVSIACHCIRCRKKITARIASDWQEDPFCVVAWIGVFAILWPQQCSDHSSLSLSLTVKFLKSLSLCWFLIHKSLSWAWSLWLNSLLTSLVIKCNLAYISIQKKTQLFRLLLELREFARYATEFLSVQQSTLRHVGLCERKQDAQLSQRDRAAGRQYFTDSIGLSSTTVI